MATPRERIAVAMGERSSDNKFYATHLNGDKFAILSGGASGVVSGDGVLVDAYGAVLAADAQIVAVGAGTLVSSTGQAFAGAAGGIVAAGGTLSDIGGGSGTIYFQDLQTGAQARTAGASQAVIAGEMASKGGWNEVDYPTAGLLHTVWPPDPSVVAIGIAYTIKDATDHFRWTFQDSLGTVGVREMHFDFEEYRLPGFGYSTTKDWEIGCWNGSTPGRTGQMYQAYGGLGISGGWAANGEIVGMNFQDGGSGAGINQSGWPTNDTIGSGNYQTFPGIPYRIQGFLRFNTPGNADGAHFLKVTNLNTGIKTVVTNTSGRQLVAGATQMRIREFQLGFSSTSPGDFPNPSHRLFRNIRLSDYELP